MRLALAQILVEGGAVAQNVSRAVAAIRGAASGCAHLVLLPELMTRGSTHPSALQVFVPLEQDQAVERLREAVAANVEPCGSLWLDHYAPVRREFGIPIAAVSILGRIESGAWAGWLCVGAPDRARVHVSAFAGDATRLDLRDFPGSTTPRVTKSSFP